MDSQLSIKEIVLLSLREMINTMLDYIDKSDMLKITSVNHVDALVYLLDILDDNGKFNTITSSFYEDPELNIDLGSHRYSLSRLHDIRSELGVSNYTFKQLLTLAQADHPKGELCQLYTGYGHIVWCIIKFYELHEKEDMERRCQGVIIENDPSLRTLTDLTVWCALRRHAIENDSGISDVDEGV